MTTHQVQITIMPLTNLLDPQGKAVLDSLNKLGLQSLQDVRIGKNINLQINADTKEQAHNIAEDACKKLLYNAVMEQYFITVL